MISSETRHKLTWVSVLGYLVHLAFMLFLRGTISETMGEQTLQLGMYEYFDTDICFGARGQFLPVTLCTPVCLYLPVILGLLTITILNRLNAAENNVADLVWLVGISLGVLTILAVLSWYLIILSGWSQLEDYREGIQILLRFV